MHTHPAPELAENDRRCFSRFDSPLIIASGKWERVIDISLSGACVEGRALPATGDRITLVLTDEADYHTAMFEAEVVWRAAERAGVRWTEVDPREQQWLEERCQPGRHLLAHGFLYPLTAGLARIPASP